MPNALIASGAVPKGQSHWAPIFSNEFFSGLYTNRNPLRDPATPFLYNKFYSATRYEAMWDGLNTEVSPRLTLVRAPGHSVFNASTFPPCLDFFSYHVTGVNFASNIRLIADTASTVYDITGGGAFGLYNKVSTAQMRFLAVGNTLYMGNGTDMVQVLHPSYVWQALYTISTGAWVEDGNKNVQLALGYAVPCTSLTISGDVIAVSCPSLTNITVGQTVILEGATPAYLNGLQLTVATLVGGGFTASIYANNIGATAQTTAYVVVPSVNGTTGASLPGVWNSGNLGVTYDGTNLWQNNGPIARPWGIPAPLDAPTVSNAINTSVATSWVASTYFMPVLPIMELGGYIYQATAAVSAAATSVPSFVHVTPMVSTTTDGGVTWLYLGPSARVPNSTYVANQVVLVTWSNTVTIPGTQTVLGFNRLTGAPIYSQGPPTTQTTTYTAFFQCSVGGLTSPGADSTVPWQSSLGTTVLDGAVTWTNIGLDVTRATGATSAPIITSGTLVAGVIGCPVGGQLVSLVSTIIDSNGAAESVITSGETGTTAPTWSVVVGRTTSEIVSGVYTGLIWNNLGTSPAVGGVAAATGAWVYTYAYGDPITGSVGPAAPLSASITRAYDSYIQVQGQTTNAPGVGVIYIYRSTVGLLVPFLIGSIQNTGVVGTWTYSDFSADLGSPGSTMNNLIQADLVGVNSAPPAGFVPVCFHLSSIWGYVNNTLYYSYGGDVVDQLGGFEAFPPGNFIQFQSNGVVAWSTSSGMYTLLNDSLQLIYGTSAPFQVTEVVHIGILSPNCFTLNGQSPYIYTSDRQIVGIDPSGGITVDGFPIGDILGAAPFSPTTAYLTWYVNGTDQRLFASDGSTGYYNMLNSISPELPASVWSPRRVITGGCSAVKAVEVSAGIWKVLVGPQTSGPILYRNTASALDNEEAYPAWVIVGSNVLCHPGQVAEIGFIHVDSIRTGTAPVVSVLLDEISGYPGAPPFDALTKWTTDPPRLPRSQSLYSNRHYMGQTGKPAWCRHLQLQITFATENALSEVLSFTMFGAIHIERSEAGG